MKDFKTFLAEQKGMQASAPGQSTEAEGGIAGLGHINKNEIAVTSTSNPVMLKAYANATVYDWSNFLKGLPSLEGDLMVSAEDKKKLNSIVKNMPDSHRKRKLLGQMEKTMTMPKSADRTRKVQDIMKQINNISMEARGVNQSAFTPKTFIPNINTKNPWSNR